MPMMMSEGISAVSRGTLGAKTKLATDSDREDGYTSR